MSLAKRLEGRSSWRGKLLVTMMGGGIIHTGVG